MMIGKREFWLREAQIAADDGHPHAALAAFAYALLPDDAVIIPVVAKVRHPAEWQQIEDYAAALGVGMFLSDD